MTTPSHNPGHYPGISVPLHYVGSQFPPLRKFCKRHVFRVDP